MESFLPEKTSYSTSSVKRSVMQKNLIRQSRTRSLVEISRLQIFYGIFFNGINQTSPICTSIIMYVRNVPVKETMRLLSTS